MANQMIALQARNPQLPDPARQTAQMANMMNAAAQQRASQLQGERLRQEMAFEAAKEARAVETQAATMREKDLDIEDKEMVRLYKIGAALLETEDPTAREAGYQNLLGLIEKTSPQLGATMRQVAGTFNPQVLQSVMMETEQYFNKKYATPIASLEIREDGTPVSVQVGGLNPEQRPVYDAPPPPMANAPRATPTAPQAAPTGPVRTGKFGETLVVPDSARPLTADQQDHIRRMQEELGMTNTPASFTRGASAGQMTPERAQQIVDAAFNTRVMAQEDFDQLMAMAPEQNKQPFMDMIRDNNIKLQPGGMGLQSQLAANQGQRPQVEFAVNRGAPRPVTLAQTQPRTVSKIQQRNPNVSPAPGIYNVPTQDVAATSRATRPSAQELYDAEAAKIKAARDAGPAPVTAQQKIARKTEVAQAYSRAQTLIDKAYNPKEGIISIANKIKSLSPDQKEAITGYSNYIPSFRGATREADTLFGNLKGVVTSLGKDAAAASGAVGNMAVQEWKIAADMIANLDLANMTPRALDAQMDRIIEQVSNATKLAERVYDIQYGDDVKQYPAFKLRGTPPARAKTPVAKGGSRLSPDIENILKSRGI